MRLLLLAILPLILTTCAPRPADAHEESQWINDGAFKDPLSGEHCCTPTVPGPVPADIHGLFSCVAFVQFA